MIHIGAKTYAPRGIARVTVGAQVVFDAAGAAGSLAVSISPDPVNGAQANGTTVAVTTDTATANPSGGVAPYSYAWSLVVNDGGTWQILSPNEQATPFKHTGVAPGATRTATFKCIATDARGRTGEAQVTAFAKNYGDQSAPTIAP